jgi:hypothetical protein
VFGFVGIRTLAVAAGAERAVLVDEAAEAGELHEGSRLAVACERRDGAAALGRGVDVLAVAAHDDRHGAGERPRIVRSVSRFNVE